MTVRYGENTEKVLRLLGAYGPMTAQEIARDLELAVAYVSAVMSRCRKNHTNKRSKQPKRVYIHSWTRTLVVDKEKVRDNPRMVFALGDKRDAPKPAPQSNAERCRKKRINALARVNSVFAIGARDMNLLSDNHE